MGRGDGDGPGEFRYANHVQVVRDTIYVSDQRLGRVSRFDRAGRFLDLVQLPQELLGSARVVGVYSNGDFLVERPGRGSRVVTQAGRLPPDTVAWSRHSPDSKALTTLASAVAMEVYGHPWAGNFALGEVMFGARAHAALDGDTLLLARADRGFEVELIDPEGVASGWFGLSRAPEPTTPGDVDEYIAGRIANAPGNADIAAWRRVFADAPVRETFPSTGAVLPDRSGNTWVQYFERPASAERWAVFDSGRRWLGDVTLPPMTNLLDVGHGRAVVSHKDELGVETLLVYDVVGPSVPEGTR